jgi:hypothetical protein
VFCEQNVSYRVAEVSTVPEPYRRFLGVWSDAAWDANTCAALIVDNDRDGTASIILSTGRWDRRAVPPILHGTGVIRDGEPFQIPTARFAFAGIVDLVGP